MRLLLLALILGCDTPRIVSSQAPGVDFNAYKTYQIATYIDGINITYPNYDNPTNRAIIVEAIASELNDIGYTKVEKLPDLLVIYDMVITDMVDPRYDSAVIYKPWVDTKLDSFNYTEGLMRVRLIENENSELIWQGSVTGILDSSPERFAQRLRKDIGKIFASLSERLQ